MREPLPVDELLEGLRRGLHEAAVPGLISAYLFGSYARDAAHRESDVDVGVLLDRKAHADPAARFDVRIRLSSHLMAAVHRDVDVVILNDAPPLLARRILGAGRRIVCGDVARDRDFAVHIQIHAADLQPWLRRYEKILVAAIRR